MTRQAASAPGAVCLERIRARTFTIPTDAHEADGTLSWDATTLILAEVSGGGETGLGYSYAAPAAADVISGMLAPALEGADAMSPGAAWETMRAVVRNAGYPGVGSSAIAAVDVAMWDLKARSLGVSLSNLLGRVTESVPVYGSGGFTSYTDAQLQRQLAGWVEAGITKVKMKVGAEPARDPERVRRARAAIGPDVELFVDANGAYDRRQALSLAYTFVEEAEASWFEEPVTSDDLAGLRLLRDRAPAPMRIAAGEYGYDLMYFRRMLDAGAVDVLQADVTRCGGVTQMLKVGALCAAHAIPLSAHTSPALHAHVCSSLPGVAHVEYFHDHVRIESMLFDGLPALRDGKLWPDVTAPGLGISVREPDAARYEQ